VHSAGSEHLPDWATKRCHDCGELFLPGFGSVWHGKYPDRHTHGGLKYCRRQADYLSENPDALALEAILAYQAIVEASQILGRALNELTDEEWTEDVATVILGASHALDRGREAEKLIAFRAVEAL
jgi:hypothetical protein